MSQHDPAGPHPLGEPLPDPEAEVLPVIQVPEPPEPEPALTDVGLTDAGIVDDPAPASWPAAPAADPGVQAIATVVIVNYNGSHLLGPCLAGLAQQDLPPGTFRTVVVDNASADPSRDLIREEHPEVELLVSYRNRGFAGGNNVALEQVTTPYAVLLNNDAVPEPDWLRTLLAPLLADPDGDLVATSSKIVFMPRFVRITLETAGFKPGGLDPRELGIKLYQVFVDDVDVTPKVLWEKASYGPEGTANDQYRWSFPTGEMFVPLPDNASEDATHAITVTVAAYRRTPVTFMVGRASSTVTAPDAPGRTATVALTVRADAERLDVINNVGGLVFVDGSGGDRGFQEVDLGQYEQAEDVFTACGNGVAIRTEAGRQVGWFDDRYFMYYEDVDLSWRLRAAGGHIRYVPGAVLRHLHGASSKPWSPSWVFHVDRNRLLTLTKDASAGRATKGVARYIATTGKMGLRTAAQALRTRRRPALGQLAVRGKVIGSFARLLPGLLRDRRSIARQAVVSRPELEKWLVTSR